MKGLVKLHLDVETRSVLDLTQVGLHNYAHHKHTYVWCMRYAFGDGPVELWTPGEALPEAVTEHIYYREPVYAHNAAFEIAIWNHVIRRDYDTYELLPEQCRCTMVMCYAMGLPGSLEKAAPAVGIPEAKDQKGHRLMLQMSKPRSVAKDGTITWWDEPEKLIRLYEYCKQDVIVERALERKILPLSLAEQDLWETDQAVNDVGVRIDIPTVKKAIKLVRIQTEKLDTQMNQVTSGEVSATTNVYQLADFLRQNGVETTGVAKDVVVDLLNRGDLPDRCRQALLLRQQAGKTSTAKLQKMVTMANSKDRVCNTLQYHAASTGRWGGRGLQLHNMPRPVFSHNETKHILALVNANKPDTIELVYDSIMTALSSSLRALITASPGNEFITSDFSNIEGRFLAWQAGEQWKLEAFRNFDKGLCEDIYLIAAAAIYDLPPDQCSPYRQIGKVTELSMGFGGGIGAFQKMATGYGVHITDERADEIKHIWRGKHPAIVNFWYALERAAMNATRDSGSIYAAGPKTHPIKFRKKGSFLWCRLPSSRVLCYPYPRILPVETPWGEMRDALVYKSVNALSRKFEDTNTFGGKLAENVTQAGARDLLAAAIKRLVKARYNIVLHVHDEIICDEKIGVRSLEDMENIMREVPNWCKDLPIACEGWVGKRYRK